MKLDREHQQSFDHGGRPKGVEFVEWGVQVDNRMLDEAEQGCVQCQDIKAERWPELEPHQRLVTKTLTAYLGQLEPCESATVPLS